jgi:tRNA G18 (ribose-2'-O)-methylase SpoU
LLPPELDVLVVEHDLAQQLVGYQFHRGVIGCGRRKPQLDLTEDLRRLAPGERLMALVGVQDPENVGCMLRTAAALGVRRIVIGPGCADPFSKRALRVSMGTTLSLEIFMSRDVESEIQWLRQNFDVACFATSPRTGQHESADCATAAAATEASRPVMLVFGNEASGLPSTIVRSCEFHTHIEMSHGVDSLNVCVSAGIILHYFCRA